MSDTTKPATDPRAMGAAWADLEASMPDGADFDRLTYYPDDGEPPYWLANVELALRDRCTHVVGCGHRSYRPDVEGHGSTADAAIRDLAAKLRAMTPAETDGDGDPVAELPEASE